MKTIRKIKRPGFATRVTIIVSALLVTANLVLGIVLFNNSKAAMTALMRGRMLDISNSAADLIDGDVLERLEAKDVDTDEYQRIYHTLKVFQDNIELAYIYGIRDDGNKKFSFTIDPADDPGEFGYPIAYTDALYTASLGTPSVDLDPYTDDWGRFYSAYSPVFDSQGKVAGIIAVDFEADWFDAQIAAQTEAIVVGTVASVLVGIGLIVFITIRVRRRLKVITDDLSEVAADVDELTAEIDPDAVKQDRYDKKFASDNIQEIGKRIRQAKDGLKLYSENLHSEANSMINALSSDYRSIFYIDLDKDEVVCYQPDELIKDRYSRGERFSHTQSVQRYANDFVTEQYREAFIHFLQPDSIRKALENDPVIIFRYMVNRYGQDYYELVRVAGVRHLDDDMTKPVSEVGMGMADVDAETRREMNRNQALSDALSAAEVASKAKTAFLSNMSHEIRTPMNAIIGLDKIALADPELSDGTRECLEKIGTSADHLLDIINDILDMSRIEAGSMTLRPKRFSLNELLDQINTMVAAQCRDKDINWHPEVAGEIDNWYFGDDVKLKQVLLNILGNAVKFTDSGGDVYFTTERTARFDGKSTLRFTIRDTGIGISEEFLPRLFEPFCQEDKTLKSKYGSTGLGMSITKNIVDMMNGEINVESVKNEGTTFTVNVTLTDSDQDIAEAGELDPRQVRVLIVDNNPVDVEYARMELERSGAYVDVALSGEEAVRRVKLKFARREPIHLVLVDLKMPDMDGVETVRSIREILGEDAVIIILTAYHWDEIEEEARAAGADDFVAKPLKADGIMKQLNQALARKAADARTNAEPKELRVLLAEDVDINAEIMETILQMRGVISERAENGRIAVEMFEKNPVGYYDAILMDVRMPEMDGLEATRIIRSLDRPDSAAIPIIALTANAFDEDVQRSLQAGLNAHLTKPVDPDNLFETLYSLIK